MQTLSEQKSFKLTPKQNQAIKLLGSDAMYYLLYGGSRSTKTFTIIRTIVNRALGAPGSRHAALRFRFNHIKRSIIYDTFPKVMDMCFPGCPHHMDKSDWFVKFPNKSEIWFGGLDDKERTEKILGNEYASIFLNECSQTSYDSYLVLETRLAQKVIYRRGDALKELRLRMYCDENPPSRTHWSHRLFIEKKDPDSRQPLPCPEDYAALQMNPKDNVENLPKSYLLALERQPERKRRRFFYGEFSDDSENSLWTMDLIDKHRIDGSELPEFIRVVVAVDPSGADDEDNETNDDIGIGVAALGSDGIAYVLEDLTIKAGPATWGKVATQAYTRHKADIIVGEKNFGGAMVGFVVRAANPNVAYKNVNASRGKVVRAEPVSTLHHQGKIKFVGRFDDMEDELCSFTTNGYIGTSSPNRADWLIWAISELFPGLTQRQREDDAEDDPFDIPRLKRI